MKAERTNRNDKIRFNTVVRKSGNSLVTSIPKSFVQIKNMRKGDKLEWVYDIKTGKLFVEILK